MANVVNKLWNMINMNTAEDVADEDYEEGADYNEEEDQEVEEPRGLFGGRKSGRVVYVDKVNRAKQKGQTVFLLATAWLKYYSLIKIERKQLRRERQLKLGTQKNGRKQLKLKIDKANKYKNFL